MTHTHVTHVTIGTQESSRAPSQVIPRHRAKNDCSAPVTADSLCLLDFT